MGNCCHTKGIGLNAFTEDQIKELVRIQTAIRCCIAKRLLKKTREVKLSQLFCKDSNVTGYESILGNVKNVEERLKESQIQHFELNEGDKQILKNVEKGGKTARVFIDGFKDVGEGRLYKGQYSKKTGERDGVGIQFWPDGSKYEGMWS